MEARKLLAVPVVAPCQVGAQLLAPGGFAALVLPSGWRCEGDTLSQLPPWTCTRNVVDCGYTCSGGVTAAGRDAAGHTEGLYGTSHSQGPEPAVQEVGQGTSAFQPF